MGPGDWRGFKLRLLHESEFVIFSNSPLPGTLEIFVCLISD